jgi:adenylate cyclase
VIDAVHCAVAIQQALHKANASLSVDRRMRLRLGINVGDVMVKEGDIFGDGVNVAARLEALAEPAGICVTRGVRDHVRDRLAYTFEDLGEHAIKNIARPVRVFRLVFDPNGVTDLFASEASEKPEASEIGTGTGSADADTLEMTFWQSVQAGDDPAEYQAYLDRYPEGLFADLARARLEVPAQEAAPKEDPAIELAFWDTVKDSDNVAMFEAYLAKYPNGAFASLARIRLAELRA